MAAGSGLSELGELRIIWAHMRFHARSCLQCQQWISREEGKSIDVIDAEMMQLFTELENRIINSSNSGSNTNSGSNADSDSDSGELVADIVGGILGAIFG